MKIWNIDFGTFSLVVLFAIPIIKDFLRPYIDARMRVASSRSRLLLRFLYWGVLCIPLAIGLVDNHTKHEEREQEARRSQGIDWANEGRTEFHAGLDGKSQSRIENALKPLRKAIETLGDFPGEFNLEIRARHDLALAWERLAYGSNANFCAYDVQDERVVVKYQIGESDISTGAKLARTIRCTDINYDDCRSWYNAEEQFTGLHVRLFGATEAERNSAGDLPPAARSDGYFFLCDYLRHGGNSLDKARSAFEMVADITSAAKQDLPARNEDALEKLAFLEALDKTPEIDKLRWDAGCMPRGMALAVPKKIQTKMRGSSWHETLACPSFDDLALLRMPYWGFDGRTHQGEMVVAKSAAGDVLDVFRHLYRNQFPIERMERLDSYGGDDGASMAANNTSAFNCRLSTDGDSLSEHSHGTAIDINPRQNPYVRGDTVLPPDGREYLDRSALRPGMVENDEVRSAFGAIGWKWGGDWDLLRDYQHFSQSGK